MEEGNSSKAGRMVAYLLIGSIFLVAAFYLLGYVGIMSMEKESRGYILLPNNYAVYKSTLHGPYEIASRSSNKTLVNPSVTEVGWNDRYVVFKRTDETLEEVGILDTQRKTVKTLESSEDNLKKLYSEFKIPEHITLQKVDSIWPDTSKNR
ncbi:hypothetical protein [Paenibacillus elgii]|uniref:hypothetical protein n=1 Tax=Paenibacillus elgii TaxID=189691 RepID=UPI00203ECBE3|nr:hypothetical protein [Paenibacillus elgii]MCM3268773.1 hypothetical protein [Paenibacillus elgii]